MNSDPLLRRALYANAAFSAVSAAIFLALPGRLEGWLIAHPFEILGARPSLLILEMGGLILIFAGLVFLAARQRVMASVWTGLIIAADLGWVLASVAVMLLARDYLTLAGMIFIALAALAVLDFACVQIVGLRRLLSAAPSAG